MTDEHDKDSSSQSQRGKVVERFKEEAKGAVGADEWRKGSRLGYLTGITGMYRAVASPIKGALSSVGYLAGIASGTFSSERSSETDARNWDAEARDRFERGVVAYGTDEAELGQKLKVSARRTWTYFGAGAFIVAYSMAFRPRYEGGFVDFMAATWPIVVFSLCLILAVRMAFFNYQIRKRAFHTFRHWLARPSEWLPKAKFETAPGPNTPANRNVGRP